LSKTMDNGKSVHGVINSSDIRLPELAPRLDWSEMGVDEHFVQFYESDPFLIKSLGCYIRQGLMDGEPCLVVATKAHREALEERLEAEGLHLSAARASGQYLALDAAEALLEFMVDGQPDPMRFVEFIGGTVARAAGGHGRVRIFGEMVALLWAEGNYDAAIRLEELWNELRATHAFSLFCAYHMDGFGGEMMAAPLGSVCAGHTSVIPAESYTELISTNDRLRAIIELQQKARSLQLELEERERLLTREQIARVEAESANRLKDEFLATVSHELRTPLTAILGWTHLLRDGGLDEKGAVHAVVTIERNAEALAQLVEDILDVSRVITGKLRLNITPVDAASVINTAIDSVQLAADSKGIQLEVTLDPSARHVSGDAARLQQVVWNLLSNSIKFTPAGGRVSVRLERAGELDAQLKVSDTGEGIRPDFLPFIFDRFRQADGTSTRRHGGLGLGLAIVRHLVELHGGTVHADSPGEGLGATFTIRLPLALPPERTQSHIKEIRSVLPDKEHDEHLETLTSLEGVRVLLVDDDQEILTVIEMILAERGATVYTAKSVAEAVEALRWYEADVLVSDLAMPNEDGYSLIAKVRELEAAHDKRMAAVALTAYVRVEDRVRALSAGFNMFVPKPVEPNELIIAIASLMGSDK
jgi:signal transduction histidine kinase/CheY-like chemotaxis protein